MESSGEAGKINISGTTYEFVKEFFECDYRGKMPVKYKGELEMYFVNGIMPDLCDENGNPDSRFFIKLQMLRLEDIEEKVLSMFDNEAASNLHFNNAGMIKNICSQADLLARAEKFSDEDYVSLKLAAILLLTGYLADYYNPSDYSVKTAEDILPKHGFSQDVLEKVRRLIKNSFSNKIESVQDKVLHDSRYDYLGRVDYPLLTSKLRKEIGDHGKIFGNEEWTEMQTRFLYDHYFLTETAKILRDVKVEDQVVTLYAEN
jgi:hypothetical protein